MLLQEKLSNYIEEQELEILNNKKSSSQKKTNKRLRRKLKAKARKITAAESDGGEPEPWDATLADGTRVDVNVDVTSFMETNIGINLGEYGLDKQAE